MPKLSSLPWVTMAVTAVVMQILLSGPHQTWLAFVLGCLLSYCLAIPLCMCLIWLAGRR